MAIEVPSWDETETRQRLSMYNERTRCLDWVRFPDQNSAVGYFLLKENDFPPYQVDYMGDIVLVTDANPMRGEKQIDDSVVFGHFTPEFGISVVRGIDQLAAAAFVHRANMNVDYLEDAKLRKIRGPIKFVQPVVPDDKMIINPSNLSADASAGDSQIIVDGSVVSSIEGIQFSVVAGEMYGMHIQGEFAKPLLVEFGAQTAVADFLHRRDSWTDEEKAKGDFLVYGGIESVDWYEEVYPGRLVEAHMIKDPDNPLKATIVFWSEGKTVARTLGNQCSVGNRERTRQLIDRLVQRRRTRTASS